ncbi:hypothetical protein E2542_SST11585 [Spatholobus suberectus]|nr:hypothetical protein E2542_SST11585 [Spatholobus suberectus]
MEQNPECAIINIPNTTTSPFHDDQPKPIQKRKNGEMHLHRVALLVMQGRSAKPNVLQVDDRSKSFWRKLVGSMRPLHLQSNQSPRSFSQPATTFQSSSEYKTDCEGYVSDLLAEEEPYSPSPPSSRYASSVGLNELVQNDEDNEKQEVIIEECEEHVDGDERIDAKADEFIAQFYQEMRLQRLDSVDRRYVERNHRSLGL